MILNPDNPANQTRDWNGFEIQIHPNPFNSYRPNEPLLIPKVVESFATMNTSSVTHVYNNQMGKRYMHYFHQWVQIISTNLAIEKKELNTRKLPALKFVVKRYAIMGRPSLRQTIQQICVLKYMVIFCCATSAITPLCQ